MSDTANYHFCGIGGSGMLPLASIVRAHGATVTGSDRSLDAGRLKAKFDYLRGLGIALFPQDGSGLSEGKTLVTSAAIENDVPDVQKADELGLRRMTRPELLAQLLNAAPQSIAIGGTSGKSTVTGMIGWILESMGKKPTVMNGAVMKNFVSADRLFASSVLGDHQTFVSEVDESDGSIALYRPTVALVGNVSLDHKSMDELRALFAAFLARATKAVVNLDDPESRAIAESLKDPIGFGFDSPNTVLRGRSLKLSDNGCEFMVEVGGERHAVQLSQPGRHNAMNAFAALASVHALGLDISEAAKALAGFEGLKRRLEIVGVGDAVTVIDDFAHNPDKMAASLATLTARQGRLLLLFQPHGYGPLKQMGEELAKVFARGLGSDDLLLIADPVYQGGTVDKSRGSDWLAGAVREAGGQAAHVSDRAEAGRQLVAAAQPGDTIAVLGARDDTLMEFAASLVTALSERERA